MADEQKATSSGISEDEANPETAVEKGGEEQVSAPLPKEDGEKLM